MPNDLDAIQEQMAALGIDVSPEAQAQAPVYDDTSWLTPEDEAMFAPRGQYGIEDYWMDPSMMDPSMMDQTMWVPTEGELQMPAYDIEELKIDIQPMLQGLPKEEFANLIIWMAEQFSLLNQENNA